MQKLYEPEQAATDANRDDQWSHTVQRLHFPRSGYPTALYLRYLNGTTEENAFIRSEQPALEIARGDTLSTNTYFNSFYESYWARYTNLETLALRLRFVGRLKVLVYRDIKNVGCRLIRSFDIKNLPRQGKILRRQDSSGSSLRLSALRNRVFHLELEPILRSQLAVQQGRLFFDFRAEEDSALYDMAIVTSDPPQAEVRLSIGLCTFNREDYLADTLQQIASAPNMRDAVTEIIIVNQGAQFSSSKVLAAIAGDPRIRVLTQPNYGGCGGFTRTIVEAQDSSKGNTHHLLMDDDIVVDNRIFENSLNFLRYLRAPVVLGGHMLDAMRPSVIYEAGAALRSDNRIVPYAHNADMSDPGALVHFSGLIEADYNAWWFCVLPLAATREIGYPAPIFIRGDDFEYGQRLARMGVQTVSMPGIGIWHEPFYAKPPGWQNYYDLRNRLIFASCYRDRVSLDPPIHILGVYLLEPLLSHNYQVAALNRLAIEDFLDGPSRLFAKRPDEKHSEIGARSARAGPRRMSPQEVTHLSRVEGKRRPRGIPRIAAAYAARIAALAVLPLKKKSRHIMLDAHAHPSVVGNRAYVMTNGPQSYFLEFCPNRGELRRGLIDTLRVYWRYRRSARDAAKAWNTEIHRWQTKENWLQLYH